MRGSGAILGGVALLTGFSPPAVSAADQCGPLKRITTVDTVTGPAGYMLVPVKIGDAQRLLLFDTGGAISGITQSAAQELHLPTYDSRVKLVGVSGAVSTRYTIIPSISVGAAESKGAEYMILPDNMPNLSRGGVAGTLAPATGVDIDLDFAERKLSFFSTDHCDGKVVYWPAGAVAVVPMRVAGLREGSAAPGRLPRRLISTEHIIIPVSLDGKQLDALVDTGAANTALKLPVAEERFGVDVNAPDMQAVGQLGAASSAKVYRKRFGTLSFEGVTVSNPVISLIPDQMTRSLGDQRQTGSLTRPTDTGLPDLIVGMDVLSKTHMYIAYGERKVYITAAAAPAAQPVSVVQPETNAPVVVNLSGSWKITSQRVAPVCQIVQADDGLKGSCTGPQATGDLTGSIAGQAVHWQWRRVANGNGAMTLWSFSGTLSGDGAIMGFAEQNGRTAPFTATKQ
jgi:predicted aspartyl protease